MGSRDAVCIGDRLELFVDEYLIDRMSDRLGLRLHHPVPREVALVTDAPWEGNMCAYVTVFQDDGMYRMYYKAWHGDLSQGEMTLSDIRIVYAESGDGIHWSRPYLGLFPFGGSTRNNIVWVGEGEAGKGIHGFAPFRDENPACPPETRYKAVGAARRSPDGLHAMVSPDGIRWSMLCEEPIITKGAFDSQNLAFWDSVRGEYRAYVRDFRDGCRGILTATSGDFVHWTDPVWLEYPDVPEEQLYTNQVVPYRRAPHLFIGFPTRYVERPWSDAIEALPEVDHRRLRSSVSERYGAAVTDGLFMSSRDGRTFRRWGEAFVRPGLRPQDSWTYGDNYQSWGVVETEPDMPGAPPELSFYLTEGYWRGESTAFRRYTLRMDGFVSVEAPLSGGELVTRPLVFEGSRLTLNLSTSAAGSIRVELQEADGRPIEGFSLDECTEVIGDEIERTVSWREGGDLARLAGRPVRVRFLMSDADLYALRFR